jgi:hypothetical protein
MGRGDDLERLRKRAQQQAEEDKVKGEGKRKATEELGRAAARGDLSGWKRCIEKQMRSGGAREVGICHDTLDHHSPVAIDFSAQSLLGHLFGRTYAAGYRRVRDLRGLGGKWIARKAYVEELGRLLGSPFRVSERETSSAEMTGYADGNEGDRSYAYAYSSGATYVRIEVKW